MANLIKTLTVGSTDYEFNAANVSDTNRAHNLKVTTDGKVTIDNNELALKSEVSDAIDTMKSYQHTITANATDGIFDVKGTSGSNAVTYAVDPYTTAQTGKFYTGTTNPTGTSRLNYGGNLYATEVYSGGAKVLTSETKNTAGATDTSSKIFLVGATSQGANPQTYTQDSAYVGTDGCLYSGSKKVIATGDAATSANKINTDAGTSVKPVYFDNGIPVEANLLEGITGNFATKSVGNIQGSTSKPVQITATTLPDLLKEVLGISAGVAPSGFNINASSPSVALASSASTVSITPTWSISRGTYTGTFTITASGATEASMTSSTSATSGTFSNTINISVPNNADSVTISGSASGTGITTLNDTTAISIKRPVSWGAGTLGTPSYYLKSNLSSGISQTFTTSNNKVMFKYPKYWGTLSNIDIPGVGNAVASFNYTTSSDGLYYIYEDKNASTATVTCTFKL